MAGVIVGTVAFAVISLFNMQLVYGLTNPAPGRCPDTLLPGIIELLLSVATAVIAWLANTGRGIFRKAFGWVRDATLATALLLLIPWPCGFSGSSALLLGNCSYLLHPGNPSDHGAKG